MPPITFCDRCEEILFWVITGKFHPNDPSHGQRDPEFNSGLRKSQTFDAECPLCAMFECLLYRASYTPLQEDSSFRVTKYLFDTAELLRVDPEDLAAEPVSRGSICLKMHSYWNRECNAFQYNLEKDVVNPPKSRSTWSLASLNKVLSWLSACKDSHSDCNTNTKSSLRLPKRLVDVDPDGLISAPPTSEAEFQKLSLTNMPKVRICGTRSVMNSPQYLTLSHRWDPNPSVLLTSDNLVQFLEEIPLSSLSQPSFKTIRDAIFVTRCLGFRYLWIDAICINQRERDDQGRDTAEELLAELEVMDQIYANGTCNISATSAKSAADGLFFDPLSLRLVEALKHRRDQQSVPEWVAITFNGDFVHFLDAAPLNTRGWVFQERMLSPRVIHFTNLQVYWECFTTQFSEYQEQCFHSSVWSDRNIGRKPDLAISAKKPPSTERKLGDPDIPIWNSLVHKFSQLSLSYPDDGLPALSALARHFQDRRELTSKDYVAGHWMPDLWFTLHWTVANPRGRQDALYLGPSWSWVSVGRRVKGPTKEESLLNKFAEILDVSIIILKVEDGDVKLGVLADGKLSDITRLRAYLDFAAPDYSGIEIRGTVPLPENDRVQFQGDRVFLGLLCRCNSAGGLKGDYAGLILYPTGKEGQFVRAGSFLLEPNYAHKKNTSPVSGREDKGYGAQKAGKIRHLDAELVTDVEERFEFDSDDDEIFYGMHEKDAVIIRALFGRFQDGNQDPTGSLDAAGRQVIEIV